MTSVRNPFKTPTLKPAQIGRFLSEAEAWDQQATQAAGHAGADAPLSRLCISSKDVVIDKRSDAGGLDERTVRKKQKEHKKALKLVIASLKKYEDLYGSANVDAIKHNLLPLKEGFLPKQLKSALAPLSQRLDDWELSTRNLDILESLRTSAAAPAGTRVVFIEEHPLSGTGDVRASLKTAQKECRDMRAVLAKQPPALQRRVKRKLKHALMREPALRELPSLYEHLFAKGPAQVQALHDALAKDLKLKPRTPAVLQRIHDTSAQLVDVIPHFFHQMTTAADVLAQDLPHADYPKALNDAMADAGRSLQDAVRQALRQDSPYRVLLAQARQIRDSAADELNGAGLRRKGGNAHTGRPFGQRLPASRSQAEKPREPKEEPNAGSGDRRTSQVLLPEDPSAEDLSAEGVPSQAPNTAHVPTSHALARQDIVEIDESMWHSTIRRGPPPQPPVPVPETELRMGAEVEVQAGTLPPMSHPEPATLPTTFEGLPQGGIRQAVQDQRHRVFAKGAAPVEPEPPQALKHRVFAREPMMELSAASEVAEDTGKEVAQLPPTVSADNRLRRQLDEAIQEQSGKLHFLFQQFDRFYGNPAVEQQWNALDTALDKELGVDMAFLNVALSQVPEAIQSASDELRSLERQRDDWRGDDYYLKRMEGLRDEVTKLSESYLSKLHGTAQLMKTFADGAVSHPGFQQVLNSIADVLFELESLHRQPLSELMDTLRDNARICDDMKLKVASKAPAQQPLKEIDIEDNDYANVVVPQKKDLGSRVKKKAKDLLGIGNKANGSGASKSASDSQALASLEPHGQTAVTSVQVGKLKVKRQEAMTAVNLVAPQLSPGKVFKNLLKGKKDLGLPKQQFKAPSPKPTQLQLTLPTSVDGTY